MSLVPATDELRAHPGAAPEPVARGPARPVGSVSDLFEEPRPSRSDAAKERLLPTVVSASTGTRSARAPGQAGISDRYPSLPRLNRNCGRRDGRRLVRHRLFPARATD